MVLCYGIVFWGLVGGLFGGFVSLVGLSVVWVGWLIYFVGWMLLVGYVHFRLDC